MSGIAGIAHLDGKPPNGKLLSQMARWLSFRGPDGQQIWTDGSVGFIHAVHLIKGDNTRAQGPETLGSGTWITADARLDARDELTTTLLAAGKKADISCSDSRLLLHAYEVWGEDCIHHIAGEFAFAIWDARRRQLFCACDQFGIRQFYFSQLQSGLVFSNSLDCVRLHPDVSDRLNDSAICDFLLFGVNCEEDKTCFADIQRLPRAHRLRWSAHGLEVKEYWRPPTDGEIRYTKRHKYIEHFNELFCKAVADRVRGDATGILLSGGVDSSSVAAACNQQRLNHGQAKLLAFTVVGDSLGDPDETAAQGVARALGIPHHLLKAKDRKPFAGWDAEGFNWPEPIDDPFAADLLRHSREIAQFTGVLLSGEGSDNLLSCEPAHEVWRTWRQGKHMQAAFEAAEHLMARFRAPDGLKGPVRRAAESLRRKELPHQIPAWINPDLVSALKLEERRAYADSLIPWHAHSRHPIGYASLFFPQWRSLFERLDAAYTRAAIDMRYPFLDLRIVNYLLAIPALPWFFRKFLLREAMKGRLPEKIRKRPKVPVKASSLPDKPKALVDFSRERLGPDLDKYVNWRAFKRDYFGANNTVAEIGTRVCCLNLWLKGFRAEKMTGAERFASAW